MRKPYHTSDIRFAEQHYAGGNMSRAELAKKLGRTEGSIKTLLRENNIKKPDSHCTKFQTGEEPWNKGLPVRTNPDGEFKKGETKATALPEKTVQLRKRGKHKQYYSIKINGKWELYHRYLYREFFGEIPEGMLVAFKDGNSLNCVPENLHLITKKQNARNNYNPVKHSQSIKNIWNVVRTMEAAGMPCRRYHLHTADWRRMQKLKETAVKIVPVDARVNKSITFD